MFVVELDSLEYSSERSFVQLLGLPRLNGISFLFEQSSNRLLDNTLNDDRHG